MNGKVIHLATHDKKKGRTAYRANENGRNSNTQSNSQYVKLSGDSQLQSVVSKIITFVKGCVSESSMTEVRHMEMPRWYDGWKTEPGALLPESSLKDPRESLVKIGSFANRPIWCDGLIEQVFESILSDYSAYARDWMLECCARHGKLEILYDCIIMQDADLLLVLGDFERIVEEEL